MRRRVKLLLAVSMIAAVLCVTPAAASTAKQKKLAKSVDSFVWEVLDQARTQAAGGSAADYKKAVKKIYGGKLSGRSRSIIAAQNTKGYQEETGYDFVDSVSVNKVRKTYTKLFGTAKPKINLPAVKNPGNETSYDSGMAKSGKKVYRLTYDSESDMTITQGAVRKSGKKYVVTRKYKYYSYWGMKANGMKPVVTVAANVTLAPKAGSAYGFVITGLTIK